MSVDKALYTHMQQAANADPNAPDIEIEITDPESLKLVMGGVEVDLAPEEDDFNKNIADDMDDKELQSIATELLSDFDNDVMSRKEWIQAYIDGLDLLGIKEVVKDEPWEGCCAVTHPLVVEALVKFQAETMMSTFPASGPVKTEIIGKETPEKKESAVRVAEDMNHQLTDVMTEYRPEHERMLWGLGLSGNAFKKVYYDPARKRQVSIYVTSEDVVVPYGTSDLFTAERVTHVMRKTENELRRLQVSGFYSDIPLSEPTHSLDDVEKSIAEKMGFSATYDNRYKILEMQVYLNLDIDKKLNKNDLALPYIVTIEKDTQTILAIRRNWEPDDETKAKRQHFVHYGYVPGFGFYCFGLIHLVGAFAKSSTSIMRQLVDAGTCSNVPGGFKAKGLRIKGDDTPIAPGEFRDVDVPSGAIRDNIMPLPYKEPSATLFQLLTTIIEWGNRFANTADLQISDMSGQTPVGTTLAILERTLKSMSAIQARIHYSMKQELGLLKSIIAAYAPAEYDYEPDEGSRRAKKDDYKNVNTIPVSDPNASTLAQKIVQYQAILQLAQGAPQLYNLPLLHRQMLEVLGTKEAHKLVPMDEDLKPTDPITENQNILRMKPVKAFLNQDHVAHITVHMAAMHDPKIMSLLQGNPQAPMMQQQLLAHVNEHLGFEYRKQIEQQLGMTLPPQKDETGEDMPMDPNVEAQLSPLLAQAATQLLHANMAEAQAQENQQKAQDPLIQMQQADLQLKQAEIQRKMQKDANDLAIEQERIKVLREQNATNAALKTQEIKLDATAAAGDLHTRQQELINKHDLSVKESAARHVLDGQKLQLDATKAAAKQYIDDKKVGVDALKHAATLTEQKRQHDNPQKPAKSNG
jgi:hypothetical protein